MGSRDTGDGYLREVFRSDKWWRRNLFLCVGDPGQILEGKEERPGEDICRDSAGQCGEQQELEASLQGWAGSERQ